MGKAPQEGKYEDFLTTLRHPQRHGPGVLDPPVSRSCLCRSQLKRRGPRTQTSIRFPKLRLWNASCPQLLFLNPFFFGMHSSHCFVICDSCAPVTLVFPPADFLCLRDGVRHPTAGEHPGMSAAAPPLTQAKGGSSPVRVYCSATRDTV